MKGTYLGEFEELVLLTVAVLDGEGYGISILDGIMAHTDRKVSVSTVHSALNRLEKKGYVTSCRGGASAVRGGRSKRIYKINRAGQHALEKVKMQRDRLWSLIPTISFSHG